MNCPFPGKCLPVPARQPLAGFIVQKNKARKYGPYCTGDERIELPLKVLETSVIPFDQSPVCALDTSNILTTILQNVKHFFIPAGSGYKPFMIMS